MPIQDFQGNTFIAYTDISGFKNMMKHGNSAIQALQYFYQAGYDTIRRHNDVNGFFVSDCGILFVRNTAIPLSSQLSALLDVIKSLNRRMLERDIMLTTAIAYGEFSYSSLLEYEGIGKHPIYGQAYVSAFLDNESERPKMQPGECRIISSGINNDFQVESLLENDGVNDTLRHLAKHDNKKYHSYYWMVNDAKQIRKFKTQYKRASEIQYEYMLETLQKYQENQI